MRNWMVCEPFSGSSHPVYTIYEEPTLMAVYGDWDKKDLFTYEVWLDGWIVSNWAVELPENIVDDLYTRRRTSQIIPSTESYAYG